MDMLLERAMNLLYRLPAHSELKSEAMKLYDEYESERELNELANKSDELVI